MQSFPVKIPSLWRQTLGGMTAGGVAARLHQWVQGEAFSWPASLPLMAAAAVLVALVYFLQPTRAGSAGLKLMTSWGLRRQLRWTDVRQVTLARAHLLQPSLKVLDHEGRVHWIDRDTRNLRGLYELALRHGGEDHPLARALRTPLHAL
ncbi:MAG: hypothetical protein KIS83_07410 [Rubrivivax sp.]|nr:hypothetical protein [Rubrivivax sp.]